ncbi:MAG: DNA polymerase III subunit delta [Bacteroidota bacterium]
MQDLKNKIYKPVYLLTGDEPFYIDIITKYIQDNILSEEEKTFNQTVLYGKDTDVPSIINAARRYPMMTNQQVIIVKEAQQIKKIEDLLIYVEKPLQSTLLVINYKYKSIDKRTKFVKAVQNKGVFFESKKWYDYQIPEWISGYMKAKKVTIDPEASMLLTEFLGNDLSKIANELEKLLITLPAGTNQVTPQDIERNIGISKDYNNYELNKALFYKDVVKANRIVLYFSKNQRDNPVNVTISTLYFAFSKLLLYFYLSRKGSDRNSIASALKIHPFFVKDYETGSKKYSFNKTMQVISLLREYDMKSKGEGNVSASGGELLQELIFKILH